LFKKPCKIPEEAAGPGKKRKSEAGLLFDKCGATGQSELFAAPARKVLHPFLKFLFLSLMKFKVEHNSIKRRLIVLFVTVICLVWVLSVSFVINTVSLKNDLTTIEDFYNLFNHVLELRRYEKNIILGVAGDDYSNFLFYFNELDKDAARLQEPVDFVMGQGSTERFQSMLGEYHSQVKAAHAGNRFEVAPIRELGKRLVDFSNILLERKKMQIHKALHGTMILVVVVTTSFFLGMLLVFFLQAYSVFKRLGLLRQATRDVIEGSFTPLPEDDPHVDEITDLIHAFNMMIREIDTKQEQLLQSRKLAAIGTFSSGIAHELNNPLNNISLTADTLQEEEETLTSAERREMVADIIHETERASKIVRNLLDFSRERATQNELVDLRELIRKTVAIIQNQLTLKYVWVEDYLPADLPPVLGDGHNLQQVFLNLFLNSLQAMDEGGLIHLEGAVDQKGYVRIEVNDTGRGIPPEQLARIFDPFFTTKPVGQGTGLGLSIAYGIVKKHGGYIEVRSKVNVGTTFAVYLPIAKQEQE
jgi:signal transduction histidine kinase